MQHKYGMASLCDQTCVAHYANRHTYRQTEKHKDGLTKINTKNKTKIN